MGVGAQGNILSLGISTICLFSPLVLQRNRAVGKNKQLFKETKPSCPPRLLSSSGATCLTKKVNGNLNVVLKITYCLGLKQNISNMKTEIFIFIVQCFMPST